MNFFSVKKIIKCVTVLHFVVGQVTYAGAFSSTMNSGSGIIAPDQVHNGNWSPSKYIATGWSGYHIVVKTLKQRNYIPYYSGESCDSKGSCSRDKAYLGPLCKSGDCNFEKEARIFKIDSGPDQKGQRVAQETLIGLVKSFDHGSVEQTLVQNPQGINLLRIDEIEAQSKLQIDESQVQTFFGFDKMGSPHQLGHIEEADAPKMFNQPESVYRHVDNKDQFVTTVIERVIPTNQTDTETSEGMRRGTMWCDSNSVRLTKGLEKLFLYNDQFDFRDCKGTVKPIDSVTTMGGFLKQAFTDRTSSVVSIRDPETRATGLSYKSVSDVSIISANGTDYKAQYKKDGKDINLFYWNSKRFNLNEMQNCPSNLTRQQGECNYPRSKLLSFNWRLDPDFEGISDSDSWILDEYSKKRSLLSSEKIELASQRVAMVAYEKVGEVYTRSNGTSCEEKTLKTGGWGNATYNEYVNPLHEKGYLGYGPINLNYNKECNPWVSSTLHLYILVPPKLNSVQVPELTKLKLIDKALAAMPDQAQMSTELVEIEDYLDKIFIILKTNAAKDPGVITLEDAVDVGTEEDHLTAQQKIWDLFGDLKIVAPSKTRIPDTFPSGNSTVLIKELTNKGAKSETDL